VIKPIFTISGIRGIFGQDLTQEIVIKYALSFGNYVKGRKIAIGRDTRLSGPVLFHSAVTGLFLAGCNAYDFGICPTPAVALMVKKLNLDAGIQITASHNPEQWNGLKFISSKGRFFFDAEIKEFKKQLNKKLTLNIDHINESKVVKTNIIDEYLHNIVKSKFFRKIPNQKFRVGIDSCNGAAENAAVKLVSMLGAIPITLESSDYGFPRPAEPKSENLKRLCSVVRKQRLDFGIAFDPDGDRFACVDELGVALSEEATIQLGLLFVLKQEKGPVVVNNSTTMAVDDICSEFRVPLYRSKTGEANVVEKMQEVKALIGGEGNGGVIFPEINNTRDGLVATAILMKLLSRERQRLSVIRKGLPQYFMQKTATKNYNENWQKIIRTHFGNNRSIKFNTQDGLKVIGGNYWVLIRQSNTEPILRIIAESKNCKLTNNLIKETIKQIKI
jgi:phosphomannomutase